MEYVEFKKLPDHIIETMLQSGNESQEIEAIHSICRYGKNYELALMAIETFFTTKLLSVKIACIQAMYFIPINYGKMNLVIFKNIINSAYLQNSKLLSSECDILLQDYLKMFNDKMDWFIENISHAKKYSVPAVKNLKSQKKSYALCCTEMESAISYKVDYDEIFRMYTIDKKAGGIKLLKKCPWCNKDLGKSLNKEYFNILRNEYKIGVPDLENFTNVPEEFKTDEWWKKRGL